MVGSPPLGRRNRVLGGAQFAESTLRGIVFLIKVWGSLLNNSSTIIALLLKNWAWRGG